MVEPTSGTIHVGGKDVLTQDAAQLRRSIGYVIQQSGLFPHRTILDNIATVPLLLGWGRKKARSRAAELLETVGLTAESGKRYPHHPLVEGALKKGDVDVANLFTTDTAIVAEGWVVLADPKNLIPGQHVIPLIADRKADSTVGRAARSRQEGGVNSGSP
jgi:ABC-type ATPase involved in cell division